MIPCQDSSVCAEPTTMTIRRGRERERQCYLWLNHSLGIAARIANTACTPLLSFPSSYMLTPTDFSSALSQADRQTCELLITLTEKHIRGAAEREREQRMLQATTAAAAATDFNLLGVAKKDKHLPFSTLCEVNLSVFRPPAVHKGRAGFVLFSMSAFRNLCDSYVLP